MITSVFAKLDFLGAAFGKRLESSHAKNDNAFVASQELPTASFVFSNVAVAKKSSAKITPIASVFLAMIFASPLQIACAQNNARALPTGGNVVAGNATITQSNLQMNINQTSQRAVVNWDSFNVGKDATVTFNQPNASAVTLNRVTGASASVIDGAVRANGQVVLVNPNGVTFGKGAQVDAAGVVASTLNISNKDFMDGKSTYTGGSTGAVVNQGKITTNSKDGYIALLAPEVRNEGYLLANKGPGNTVAMASGEKITLDFRGDQLISVKVDQATYKGLIENKRLVEVPGGLIVVAAGSASGLMATTINNTGVISASSVVDRGGMVDFVAANINQAGKVVASGKGANSDGGTITMVGENINLASGSKTIATGTANGGTINIGTSGVTYTQNANGTRSNVIAKDLATTTTVAENALVNASSTSLGNGGQINIWSSVKTSVAGSLKALGGVLGGNGGFIETSSTTQLIIAPTASIDTSAPKGKVGQWLLDPIDLTIDAAVARVISLALSLNNVTIEVSANSNACPSIGACTQNGTGNLTIASGADILKQGNAFTSLTLSASGMFTLNANIIGQNLNVIINSSIAYLNVGSTIEATQVTVQAQTVYANGTINTYGSNSLGGAIQLLAQALYVSGRLNTGASTGSTSNTTSATVTYNGTVLRQEDLPTFLAMQNNLNATSNALDVVYSATSANDASYVPLTNNSTNVITLNAAREMVFYSTAEIKANGTTGFANGAAGAIYLTAPSLTAESGSLIQANGNNGPGGTIAANGGDIHLAGTIQANGSNGSNGGAGGSFALTANTLTIDNAAVVQTNGQSGPGGTITLTSNQDIQVNQALISANGDTDGGSITIVSNAGNLNIQNTVIQTNGSTGRGGSIATSANNGNISISSAFESIGATQGGNILITANNITLENNVNISATGNTGGGIVLIGGDWQGSNGVYQATTVTMNQGAVIDASALINGDGGKVVLWSDITNSGSITEVHGTIYAKGGSNGGNGGQVETSASALNFDGIIVDTSAINGHAGMWLLDPYNFFMVNSLATVSTNLNNTDITITTTNGSITIGSTTYDLTSYGYGHIVFTLDFSYSGSRNAALTLTADGDIYIQGNISATGSGKLGINFNASGDQVYVDGNISTNGGSISFSAQDVHFQKTSGAQSITTGGGNLSFNSSNIVLLRQSGSGAVSFDTGAGSLSLGSGSISVTNTQYGITAPTELIGWGGTSNWGDTGYSANIVAGREYSLRLWYWDSWDNERGELMFSTSTTSRANEYWIFYSDANVNNGSFLFNHGAPAGTLYSIGNIANHGRGGFNDIFVDITFRATQNGFLRTWNNLNEDTGNEALEINNLRETGLSSNSGFTSGGRGLSLASTTGQITGSGNISGLTSLTVNTNNASGSLSGVISGSGTTLTKQGTGTLSLTGINTYTGGTTINGGILSVASGGSSGNNLSSGTVTIGASGILLANATGTISNAIVINAYGGTIAAATGSTLTIGGNITSVAPTVGASGYAGTVTFGNGLTTGAFSSSVSAPLTISYGTLKAVGTTNNYQQGGTGVNPTILINNGGTLDMGGLSNNYASAAVTLNNGTLTNSATTGSSNGPGTTTAIVVGTLGGTVSSATGSTLAISGVVSGSGALTIGSSGNAGTISFTGGNTYTGGTTISAGTLKVGHLTALGTSASAVSVASGAVLDLNGIAIANTNALTLNGTGISSAGAIVNSLATAASYAGAINLATDSSVGGSSGAITLGGIISGGALTKVGSNTITLSNTNTYTGGTTISAGILSITTDRNLGALPGAATANSITLSGGTLQAAGAATLDAKRGITLTAASGLAATSTNALTVNGVIDGANALTINGASQTGTVALSGANTYSGTTTITAGTLAISNESALGSSVTYATTIASGAVLSISGGLTISNPITNNGGSIVFVSGNNTLGGALALGADSAVNAAASTTQTISGVISGGRKLSINSTAGNTGTVVLSGANTYTGGTTVAGGLLKANIDSVGSITSGAFGTGTVTVNSGYTLDLNGRSVANALNLSGAGLGNNGALINSSTTAATDSGVVTIAANTSIGGTGAITLSGAISAGANTVSFVNGASVTATNTGNSIAAITITGSAVTLKTTAALSVNASSLTGATTLQTVAAGKDITITGAITNNTDGNALTLMASRDVLVSASISGASGKSLTTNFYSDVDNTGGGGFKSTVSTATVSTFGGDITIRGGTGDTTSGCIASYSCIAGYASYGGALADHMGVLIWSSLNAAGGNIAIYGRGDPAASTTGVGIHIDFTGTVFSTTGAGTITLNGVSTGAERGINHAKGDISAGNGLISITATAGSTTAYTGYRMVAGSITSNGALSIAGTGGVNEYGVYIYGAGSIVVAGDITIDGQNASRNWGVSIEGSKVVQTTAGNISVTAVGKSGFYLVGSLIAGDSQTAPTTGGTITINATGSSNYGLQINAGSLISKGAISITTAILSGAIHAFRFEGATGVIRTTSDITIQVTSTDWAMTMYGGRLIQSTGGNISIALTGAGGLYMEGGSGIVASNDTTNPMTATPTSGGTLTINATGTSVYGIQVPAGTFISYGAMSVTARGTGAYKGMSVYGTGTFKSVGNITIDAATTGAEWGFGFDGSRIMQSTAGNISITAVGNYGMYLSGSIVASASTTDTSLAAVPTTGGSITISATGRTQQGLEMAAGSLFANNAISITGSATGGYHGVKLAGAGTTKAVGNITINASNTGAQWAFYQYDSRFTQSTTGNISITATALAGHGMYIYGGGLVAGNSTTAPTAGGSITINSTSGANNIAGAALRMDADNTKIIAYGDINIYANGAAAGLNIASQQGHGVILWGSSQVIRSHNGALSITGYASQYYVYNTGLSDYAGGITLYSGSDLLQAKGNVTLNAVNMPGIALYLTVANASGGGVISDTGNIVMNGLSNNTAQPATYIRMAITATLGSVSISGAGNKYGIYQDAWSGSVTAKTDVNMMGYALTGHGIYYGIGPITSSNGNVILSGYTSSTTTTDYGIYSNAIGVSASNGSVTFQGSKMTSASTGSGYLINAAATMSGGTPNIPAPLFAVADSASSAFAATYGVYWTGAITANTTTGQINLYAKAPYISGIMTAYGLFLGAANQSYSLSGSNAVISVLAGSIGTGSLTLQTASNLEIGSLSGVDGFTGSSLSITETATLSQTKPINVSTLTLAGTNGVFNLDQANTVSTGIAVNSGTLKVSNASALGAASAPITMAATSILLSNVSTLALGNPITMSGAATINAPSTYVLTLSGILSGAGNLTINSPTTNTGTVIFTGANNYTGTTTISAGTLQIGSGSTTGALGAGAITNNAALIFNRSNDFTVANAISGTGTLNKAGAGATTLTANNTFSGGTTVDVGTLILSDSYGIAGNGVILGTLTVNASGVVQLKNNPGAFGWSANRVTILNINGGLVEAVGSGNQHIWNATVNFNGGGILRTNGGTSDASTTSYWEWGNVTVNVTNPTAVAEIGGRIRMRVDNTASTYTVADGVVANDLLMSAALTEINGAGTFTKAGAGTMTLSGANSFTGAATVNAGTLAVSNAAGLGTSAGGVTVASGATLDLQNIAVGAEATTLNGGTLLVSTGTSSLGGTVALGANSTVNVAGTQLTISGAISGANFGYTKSGAGDLILTATNTYTGATTISAGTLIFQNDAPSLTSISFTGPGSLVVKPNGTSFTSAYTFDESLSTVTKLSALTLGKSGNTANITVSTAANVAGPITIYGGNIVVSNALNTTGATGSTGLVSLYASDSIKVSGNITTTGAAVLITSNTDGLNGGAINLNASTISTSGGNITLGGGSDGSGYAEGSASSIQDSFYRGMWISGSTLNAAGGNIALRGKGWQGATFGSNTVFNSIGIDLVVGTSIYTSGTGDITLNGVGGINYSPANHSVGVNFYTNGAANSIYTASGNVLVTGAAGTGTARTYAAINNDGGVASIYSTAGNVTLTGNGASADKGINVISGATLYIGYNSADTVNTSGNILLQANSLNVVGALNLKNSGLLTIEPIATGFTSAFSWPVTNINILSTAGLTLGKSGNTSDMTIGSAVTIAGPIKIYGGNIAINAALTASGTNTIWLYGSGNVTDGASGYLVADKLALIGGAVTLNSTSNNVGTIAGESLTSLTYVDSNALTIGVVNPTGITATGLIDISTVSGNLTVSENITTSSSANNAIVLNASSATAAGTSTGGNILISNTTAGATPTLTTGAGGRVTLYTGGVSGSTGLTDLIGSGTGHFRYYSDETTTNYNTTTAALSTGMYAIYRERPVATITTDSQSITYGDTLTLTGTTTGLVNGDVGTYAVSSPLYSTSNNIKVGTYTIVGGGPIALGYSVTATNGTLTVGQKAVTISGFTVADKAYDGATSATVTNAGTVSGKVTGDAVTVASVTAAFTNKNAGLQNLIIGGGTLSGADAANYTSSISGSTTATINPKAVTLTAPVISKTYNSDLLYTTQAANLTSLSSQLGVSGDTVTAATLAYANKDAGASNKTVNVSAATISDGNSGNNYAITYASNSTSTIAKAALTVTGANTTTTYSGLAQTNSAATITGLQGSDNFTISGYGVGTNYRATAYADTLAATPVAGTLATNYTISYTNGGITIGKAALVATADNKTRIYGNANPTLTYTVTGYVNGEGASVLTGAPTIATTASATSNVGDIAITATANTLTASNYSLSYVNGTLSITPAALSITGANASATYTGLAQTNTAATVVGLKNSDSFTITGYGSGTNASATAYADNLVATQVAGTLASNYTISYTNGGITIGKANATVTGNSASVTYTGVAQSVAGYTATGLVNSETIAVLTGVSASGATGTNATSYTNTMSGTDSNYNLTLVNGTLTIGKAAATVTGNSANVTYNATSQSVSGYTATGLVNGETIAVLTGVTASGATGTNYGTYTNTVAGTDSNYTLTLVNGSLAIAKAALTVTGANTTTTYSGLAQTNSAATITGLQGSDNFTISGYGVGTNYRATAYADTLAATPVAGTLATNYTISYTNGGITIGKAALVATADNKTRIYGNANPTLTYTVTGYVNGEGASVLTGAPTIATTASATSNVGDIAITATANTLTASNYSLSYVNGTLSITPAALSITGANASATYTGLAQTNTAATVVGLKNSDSFTITGYGSGTNASATAYADNLVATQVAGTLASNYTISYTNGGITIGKANATVTGNSASVTYTGVAQSVAGYTATGLVNSETIAVLTGVSASGATGTNATSYTNTMSGTDSNYNLTLVNGTLTIGKAAATVTGNSANVTYNATSQSVSGYTATGLVNGETIAVLTGVTASGATGTNYGTYTNTVAGTDSNYTLTLVNGSLAIAKAALTVTGANTTTTYSGLAQTNSAATITGLQGSDNFTISGYGVGTNYRATAYADTLAATPVAGTLATNYTISYTNGGITIGKAALVATADNKTRIYGNANPTLTYTVTGYVNGEGASVLTGAPTIATTASATSNVGDIAITATANTLTASNYSLSYVNGTLSITPAALSITGANASATYTGLAQTNTAATVVGLKNSDSFTITGYGSGTNASATAYADNLVATQVAGTLASNYTISYTNGGITIGKANATVTGNSASVTYTGVAQSVAGYTATGLVNSETIAVLTGVSASGATGTNATSYTNTMSGTDSNYNLTLVNGTLTIGKAAATVTGNSANVTYNATSQSVSGYTATGLVNGETIAVLTGVTASGATGTNYGTYTNTVAGTDSNYTLTLVNGSLAIAKAALTVTGANTTTTYSGLAQTNSAATITGLQGSDNFTISGYGVGTNYRATAYADTLAATPVAGTLATNYTISYTNGGITIGKAALVATADNKTRIYGNANPTLTYTVTGYVNGEGASVLTGAPTIATTASATSNVGDIAITATANTLTASNYSLSYVNGTLSITPAALSITGANASATYTGLAQTNTAATVVGLKNSDSFTITGYGSGTNASATAYADNLVATQVAGTLASNYTISYTNGGITIGKANATVTGNSASVTYTGVAQSVAGYTATGLVNSETIAVLTGVSASGATGTNATSYTNTMSGTDSNYNLTLVNGTLTIGKAAATVTGNSANVTYNATSQSVSGYTATGLVNGETIAVLTGVTASGATGTNYGTYTNTVAGTDSNYTLTLVNGSLAIAKAALTVTGANTTTTYSGLAQTNSAATITGLQGSDNFTISGYGVGTNYRATAYADTLAATPVAGTLATNYTISYTNGGITIGKAALVATADNKTRIYGNANPTLTYTVTGYVNGEGASVLTGAPTIATTASATSNVGDIAITATANTLTASNYSLSYVNGTLSITPAALSITGANASATYTGLAQTNTAATVVGLKNSDSFTITGYGSGTNASATAYADNLVATQVAGTLASNYTISYTNGGITIGKANATVTGNSASVTYTGVAQSVAGYTATGLVNSETIAVLTGVSASGATGTNATSYTNTMSGTDSNYNLTLVNGTLTIGKAAATVTGNSANVTYNATSQSVSGYTATGLVNGETIAVLTGVTASGATGTNYGTYTNTVAGTDSNYTLTLVNGSLAIAKAALTVTGANTTTTYSGLAQTNSAATITGLQGSDNFTISGYGVGTNYRATAYADTLAATPVAGTLATNYTISYTNGGITIGKAALVATADNKTRIYGNANPTLTYTVTGYVNGEGASVLTGAPTIATTASATSNVGDIAITATANTLTASNYSLSYVNGTLSITPAALSITGANASATYTGLAQTNTAATVVGLKNSDSFTITGYGSGTNASATAYADNLVATQVAGTLASNYTISYTNGGITIGKANATVTGNSASVTYTGVAQSVAGYTATGLVNSETIAVLTGVSASGATGTNATSYTNTMSGTDSNYNLTLVNGTLTIGKAAATVTGNSANVTYNATSQSVSGYTATGLVNGETIAVLTGVTASGATGTNYGTYTNTVAGTDSNYTLTLVNGSLAIAKAALTVTGANTTTTYSGLAQTNSAATITGLQGSDNFTISGYGVGTNYRATAYADTLAATPVAGTLATNYTISYTNGGITIGKAALVATADNKTRIYGNANPTLTYTVTGYVNGEGASVLTGAPTIATTASATSNVGDIAITATANTLTASNYSLSYVNGTLSITARPITITADAGQNKIYGNADLALTYAIEAHSANRGLVNGDSFTGSLARTTGENVGTYAIAQGSVANTNYTINYVADNLAITARPITLTANSGQTKIYGNTDPTLTYSIEANATNRGLVGSDSFTGSLTRTAGENVGSYAIAQGSVANTNYTINYVADNLAITAKNLTVINSVVTTKTYDALNSAVITGGTLVGVVPGDVITLSQGGTFASVNAGSGIAVTANDSISGVRVGNYTLTQPTGLTGTINRLDSVTYIGASGGNWSLASNWTNSALPVGNNVATVYIPSGVLVKYDSAIVSPVQSTISNLGTLQFANSVATDLIASVVGSGSISQTGSGALTISGNNVAMTGNVWISNGSSLILANRNSLGSGKVISDGGYLGAASGIRLPSLNVEGLVRITSDITSLGAQNYAGPVLLSAGDVSLTTTNADITFGATVNAQGVNRSLTLNAGSGQVTFNGKVGDIAYTYGDYLANGKGANIAVLDVAAGKILINADIQTVDAQIYRGPVIIGDNGSNGRVRNLLSVDPSITFTSTVDDVLANTHTLQAAAVSFNSVTPSISFTGAVGSIAPLFAMDVVVGIQDVASPSKVGAVNVDPANYFGDITISGDVSTLSNQTYTASKIALGGNQGTGILNFTSTQGQITFNTRTSAPGGFVVKDGALLTEVNMNVLNDSSVVGFSGLPAGVASRLNKPVSSSQLAKMERNNSVGVLHATLVANNNFQMMNVNSDVGGVTVSSPQDTEVCSSQQDSQGCAQ